MAYRYSQFNASCLLSCRDNSMLFIGICRPSVTLHQDQCLRNEHTEICHSYDYRHAKRECHSLNTARDMAITVQVKKNCHNGDAGVTLSEEPRHRTEKRLSRPLVGPCSQQT